MRILVSHPDGARGAEWVAALRASLPGAQVESWHAGSAPADFAVGWAVPPGLFARQPGLRAFFCAGAGVDDLLESRVVPRELPIIRLQDAGMGEQMADFCAAAVLDWYTGAEAYAAQQAQGLWRELPLQRRADWRIGILGQGVLGDAVAGRFEALGFPVTGVTRRSLASGAQDLQAFLGACRVLILLAPLTSQTRGLLDAERLAQLPRGAFLVNVSRGPLVVESALLAALDSGQLAAAALDVFAIEPLPAAHPYWRHPRIRLTPHVAAYTVIEPAARQIAAGIAALESGVPPGQLPGQVGRERGY